MDLDADWKFAKKKKTKSEKIGEKKMRNSYFTQQYESFGEDFVNFKNVQDIRNESYKIFKSLADGAIDFEKHSKCFYDPVFINTLKDISYENMMYHHCTKLGLQYFINENTRNGLYVEGFIYDYYTKHQRSAEAYTLLFNAFSNIQLTYDINVLISLIPTLNKYRFYL